MALEALASRPAPDPLDLAAAVSPLKSEKFHPYLSRQLQLIDAAASGIDAGAVPDMARAALSTTARIGS
jgi:hypothetical protein